MSADGPSERALNAGEGGRTGALFFGNRYDVSVPCGRGVPRTAAEWTGLVKVASGEYDIGAAMLTRLVQLGLLEGGAGDPVLTRHGRLTLGLSD
jgi:hypothetical protein